MARAAAASDIFTAIAEPARRTILELLADGERAVSDLVGRLGIAQPQVSKHLRVLRTVGLVSVRRDGRHRLYRLNGEELKPVHDWTTAFEEFWTHQLAQVKARAERRARTQGET